MARRRIDKGQCFNQPCFGCREFPANFEPADPAAMQVPAGLNSDADLGLMLYDVFDLDVLHNGQKVEARPQVTFFRARLEDGVVNVPLWGEVKKQLGAAR